MNHLDPTIRLGCSFTAEKFPTQENAIEGFRFILDDMSLRRIRFALRWNQIMQDDGSLSLSKYNPFFDLLNQYHDLYLCLNLGPIKTTDWPEVHVPDTILEKCKPLPTWPDQMPYTHQLIRHAGEYLHQLCGKLKAELPSSVLSAITTIQLDNEGYNPFGENLIVLSIDTELYFESIVSTYFPGRKILFNSAGKLQTRKILKTMRKLDSPSILGIDYYYHTPTNDYPIIRNYNQLNLPLPWLPKMSSIIKSLEESGNELEFTEVQMEKWGHIEYPGTSPEALIKVLNLLARYKPKHQKTILMRLWGVELFADAFLNNAQTPGMVTMLDIISSHSS